MLLNGLDDLLVQASQAIRESHTLGIMIKSEDIPIPEVQLIPAQDISNHMKTFKALYNSKATTVNPITDGVMQIIGVVHAQTYQDCLELITAEWHNYKAVSNK